ncbi:hypothetical protein KXX14_007566, partial [Aspergillus fumigatus]
MASRTQSRGRHRRASQELTPMEMRYSITPPSSVTDWYAMVQLFGHPSAPWPWDRARALWTAFGIFMPFVFDLSLAKAKEND